jgi:uncharacterized protein YkwD
MSTTPAPARPRRTPARTTYRRVAATLVVTAAVLGSVGACTRPGPRPAHGDEGRPAKTAPDRQRPEGERPERPPVSVPDRPVPTVPERPAPPTTPMAPVAPAPASPAASGWQAEMLALVNAERAKAGLNPMALCGTINRAAQSYAEAMAARGVLSHTGADGSTPATRMRAAGYVAAPGQRYMYGAENIAQGYRDVPAVMTGWMNSSGHRANILAPATTHLGVGRSGNWWVQNFGTGGTC